MLIKPIRERYEMERLSETALMRQNRLPADGTSESMHRVRNVAASRSASPFLVMGMGKPT